MKEKIKNIVKEIINSKFLTIFIGVILLLKTILFYKVTVNITESVTSQIIVHTLLFIFSLMGILYMLPKRARNITGIVINVLLSILLFADNLYYLYSNNMLSILQIGNLQYGEEIKATLPMLFKMYQILYGLDLVLGLFLVKFFNIKIVKSSEKSKKDIVIRFIIGCSASILLVMLIIDANVKAAEMPYNRDIQIKRVTIYGYHISDIYKAITNEKNVKYKNKNNMLNDYNRLKDEYENEYGESYIDCKGKMKGKNVIILQLESMQEFVLNKTINGKQITPNLNKFINENIELSNMYMQSYSTTADSEFSTVTSLYPVENGMAYSRYFKNTYDDIFKMFHKDNYTTSYMHGNYGDFWNRASVYGNMDVDHVELKDKFKDTSEDVMGYLSDELLYKQAVEKMQNYNEPFMSYIVSASSHTGFTLDGLKDRSKINIDVGGYKNTFFGNYLESVNYADYAFGKFIQELKDAKLYDDSVIILYGDHNGLDMYNEEMLEFLREINPNMKDTDIQLNYIRVIAGMKIPGINNLKIDKPVSKLDIKPTLSYLCDLEEGISLGTNMLARKDFICLNNERIVTKDFYYDENWYDRKTGEIVNPNSRLDKYYNYMKEELEISKSIVVENLLK